MTKRQRGYPRGLKREQADDDAENSDDKMESPFWVGSTMPNGSDYANTPSTSIQAPKNITTCAS